MATMSTTLTLTHEGPPVCRECASAGHKTCPHTGFNPDAWQMLPGMHCQAPGLDPAFTHTVRSVEIAADRNTVAVTVDTERADQLDLARHLSVWAGPHARVQARHHDTGDVLAEGGFNAPLQEGQPVWVNGDPHVVVSVEHPNRDPDSGTTPPGSVDIQVARLQPLPPPEPITPLPPAPPAGW